MLKTTDGYVVPNLTILRPDGSEATFTLHTKADEALVAGQDGNGFAVTLDQIEAAKAAVAIDATDGVLDHKVGALEIAPPMHTIFWSDNSAARLMMALAEGQRELFVNGKKVEVTEAFKQWVLLTMTYELAPVAPQGS